MSLATDLVGRTCTYNEPVDMTPTGLRYKNAPAVIRAVYGYVENGTSKYSLVLEADGRGLVECRLDGVRLTKECP